ncbi:hypothetical protein PHISCL_06785 [Aspergillus sclerotialis]|uniref:Mitochondrial import inner membrane translocase subunit n=1 Tax=Aspergillus sclerotialis TaxID=2070753 RepID=A0A3A2ZCK6_9EURO|nr:hypothetical protein PHISCL_06785 [Aspergillus sclerotialis]
MALFGSGSSSNQSQQDAKAAIIKQVQAEAAVTNARALISRVNEHCFEHCIPKPGSTMSSSEESCLSNCMEKYISMWNVVNRTYVSRISSESKRMGQDAVALSQLSTPSDK